MEIYIYLQFRFRLFHLSHTNPHQVAIALENAAESNLIGLKPTVDSTVRRQFAALLKLGITP